LIGGGGAGLFFPASCDHGDEAGETKLIGGGGAGLFFLVSCDDEECVSETKLNDDDTLVSLYKYCVR
jgi:hypothetical protein